MAKLLILKAPKNFTLPVVVPTPNGDDDVNFDAKHLLSTEWAALRDKHAADVKKAVSDLFDAAKKKAADEYDASVKPKRGKTAKPVTEVEREAAIATMTQHPSDEEIAAVRAKHAAALIFKITEGWDLDDTFNLSTLEQMCKLYPGAPKATFTAYGDKLEGNRSGNSEA